MNNRDAMILVVVTALCTFITRSAPFFFFQKREVPETVRYLGKMLPSAIMAILIIYCLKGVKLNVPFYGVPEGLSVIGVVVLHLWKKNTLLSIAGGTILYMVLLRI